MNFFWPLPSSTPSSHSAKKLLTVCGTSLCGAIPSNAEGLDGERMSWRTGNTNPTEALPRFSSTYWNAHAIQSAHFPKRSMVREPMLAPFTVISSEAWSVTSSSCRTIVAMYT